MCSFCLEWSFMKEVCVVIKCWIGTSDTVCLFCRYECWMCLCKAHWNTHTSDDAPLSYSGQSWQAQWHHARAFYSERSWAKWEDSHSTFWSLSQWLWGSELWHAWPASTKLQYPCIHFNKSLLTLSEQLHLAALSTMDSSRIERSSTCISNTDHADYQKSLASLSERLPRYTTSFCIPNVARL